MRIWIHAALILAFLAPAYANSPEHDVALCNRTSFIVEAAVGLEEGGAAATRGWFAVAPGGCRVVFEGGAPSGQLLLHARVAPFYGVPALTPESPMALCVGAGDFTRPATGACDGPGEEMLPFVAVTPRDDGTRAVIDLSDGDDYTLETARIAGLQRLLTMAGFDARPIDGTEGEGTDAAKSAFLAARRLPDSLPESDLLTALGAAAARGPGIGIRWCNDTAWDVMAAYGVREARTTTTAGWYKVSPGRCLMVRDDVPSGGRVYSYAEAINAEGLTIRRDGEPVQWAGDTALCTRSTRFELSDHDDCSAKGNDTTSFQPFDSGGAAGVTVRFEAAP